MAKVSKYLVLSVFLSMTFMMSACGDGGAQQSTSTFEAPVPSPKPAMSRGHDVDPSCAPNTANPCTVEVRRERGSKNQVVVVPGVNVTGGTGF